MNNAERESARAYRLDETLPLHREMRDALEETLDRATRKNGVPLFLMGGVSASLLARDAWPTENRPLSRDLDFLVPGDDASRAALAAEYGGAFKLNTGKAVFKSDKLQSHSAGNGVELDFIASSNIVHDDAEMSVTVSPLTLKHAGKEEFLGVEVATLAPELVALQKLFAGRGLDLGKYDLLDSEAILRSGRVDPALLREFFFDLAAADKRPAVAKRLLAALDRMPADLDLRAVREAIQDAPAAGEIEAARQGVRGAIDVVNP